MRSENGVPDLNIVETRASAAPRACTGFWGDAYLRQQADLPLRFPISVLEIDRYQFNVRQPRVAGGRAGPALAPTLVKSTMIRQHLSGRPMERDSPSHI